MSSMHDAGADAQANGETEQCPPWCAGEPAEHQDEEGMTIHRRLIGSLGVAIEWCPGDPNDSDEPVIYVPLEDKRNESASPAFARELAADLIAAADVLDACPKVKPRATASSKIGTVVRGEMAAQRIKTREMAAAIGISPAALRNRLNGRTQIMFSELLRIADKLNFPPHELLAAAEQNRRPRRSSGRSGGSSVEVHPWELPFDGTPEELESALWPLGVRLRAAEDRSQHDRDDKGRALGGVDWWPDDGEIIVTPDLRSNRDETIQLLRYAERVRLDPDLTQCFEMRRHAESGDRYMNLCLHAGR